MAARTKNRKKNFKRYLLLHEWPYFKIISQKCSLVDPLPKLLKWFRSAEEILAKFKTEIHLNDIYS